MGVSGSEAAHREVGDSEVNRASSRWLLPWRPLRSGDIVDVVAPASAASLDQLEAAVAVLERWGLRARVPAGLLAAEPFFANSDAERWRHLRRALTNTDSRAVWCLRGGVGSLRLVPKLVALKKPTVPKPLIGFSDISVLHTVIDQSWRGHPVHGPVLTQLLPDKIRAVDIRRLRDLLFGKTDLIEVPGLRALNEAARRCESVSGRLAGGNLATLQTLAGTPGTLQGRGRIICLEDTNERGYTVDRMLAGLRLSGAFSGAHAIVFGDFDGDQESDGRRLAQVAIGRFANEMRCPVFGGMPIGHQNRSAPFVYGLDANIVSGTRGARLEMPLRTPHKD